MARIRAAARVKVRARVTVGFRMARETVLAWRCFEHQHLHHGLYAVCVVGVGITVELDGDGRHVHEGAAVTRRSRRHVTRPELGQHEVDGSLRQ